LGSEQHVKALARVRISLRPAVRRYNENELRENENKLQMPITTKLIRGIVRRTQSVE